MKRSFRALLIIVGVLLIMLLAVLLLMPATIDAHPTKRNGLEYIDMYPYIEKTTNQELMKNEEFFKTNR